MTAMTATDPFGLRLAAARGVRLGEIGHRIVFENEHVRIWEVRLEPGETIDFHIHHHPYIILSLGGGHCEIETIFGEKIMTYEPLGNTVFMNEARPVHRLTNRAAVTYLSRLIELKHLHFVLGDAVSA
jgi:hypothetical protein